MDDPAGAFALTELPITYTTDPDNMYDPCDHELCEPFFPLRACHDIAVFLPGMLVAGACAQEAQLWRLDPDTMLPDTENPLWVFDDPVDENGATGDPNDPEIAVDFWHSATFSWDGRYVHFEDESFSSGSCPPRTPAPGETATQPGDTGRIVREEDVPALTNALQELYADRAECERLGAAGRRRVMEEFSDEAIATKTLGFWRKVTPASG
jgi:hypothetical protein